VHDDAFYVPKVMFERWAENDPLERYRTWLRENADMTDEDLDTVFGTNLRGCTKGAGDIGLSNAAAQAAHAPRHDCLVCAPR